MIRNLQVWLWSIIAELEYRLYPWKTKTPPSWAVEKYNLDHGIEDEFENNLYYGWLKSHDEKINKVEENLISMITRLEKSENYIKILEEANVEQTNSLYECWNSLDARIDILAEYKTDV